MMLRWHFDHKDGEWHCYENGALKSICGYWELAKQPHRTFLIGATTPETRCCKCYKLWLARPRMA
jgi:hypothetical protein